MSAEVLDEIRALREQVAELARVVRAGPPRCLSPDGACQAFSVGRSTFDRWLNDPSTGLEAIVLRPNGDGGRVLVPVDDFEAWLRERSRGPQLARRGA